MYRAHYFFSHPTIPTISDLAGERDRELAVGETLTTTGTMQANWYLVYPSNGGTFRYRSGNFVSRPTNQGTLIRNGVSYQILEFPLVTPGITFNVEADS